MAEITPDPQQKKAIEHVHGPMLVVAGAGTGKTTVLVQRIVNLIAKDHARADEVLAITYTRNAAQELRQRVAAELGGLLAGALRASTFHAFCGELLKRAGMDFTPITKEDLFVLLRRRIKELPLKHYIKAQNLGQFLPALLAFFERCDDELITPESYAKYVTELKEGRHPLPRVLKSSDAELLKPEEVIARCEEISAVFARVWQMLAEKNLGTYGNMISRAVTLLEGNPQVLKEEQERARFILIDEFQDSNVAQIRLAKLLAGDAQNVFAVGDPDQAIYRFRGATTGAFDQFLKHFHNVKHVSLEQNRRSLSPILRCAFKVIDQNPPIVREGLSQRKPLVSAREAANPKLNYGPVELVYTPLEFSCETEAAEIGEALERAIAKCPGHETRRGHEKCSWRHFAVLYRSHQHREELAAELSKRKIPIDVRGVNVLETPEVRDAMAALRAIYDTGDSAALFRLASLSQFGIDAVELRAALRAAKDATGLAPVLAGVKGGAAVIDAVAKARKVAGPLAISVFDAGMKSFDIMRNAATQALRNFIEEWQKKAITAEGTVAEFLEYLEFFGEVGGKVTLPEGPEDEKRNAVQFMTAHGAKGLEFPHVFVVRSTTSSFPGTYREELFEFPQALREGGGAGAEDPKELHYQEERRLFYVAMTRARDTLSIYGKRSRIRKPALPPRFDDATPPGLLRDFATDKALCDCCVPRMAEFRPEIAATASEVQAFSTTAEWMLLPPSRPMEKIPLSATRIETYEKCPLQFKISADWNIPSEPMPALQFGNAVHTALKGFNDALKAGRPLTKQQFLRIFEEQMEISHFDDAHQKQLYVEQGLDQLGKFYDLRNSEKPTEILAVETTFELNAGGVKVVGRIDRADRLEDGSIAIVDYKTGSPKDEEDAKKSLQLSIYALAAEELWKSLPARIAFYNLESNDTAETERSEQELSATRAKITDVADAIKAAKFAAKPGFHCKWCGYRELCPVKEEPLWVIEEALPAKSSK
ncbi:MAG TPA: ATP-dependent DNA helicase [Terriglobales bacterium]|nr:ATP-dependent DNA helicase [Terriglobales bacterium]